MAAKKRHRSEIGETGSIPQWVGVDRIKQVLAVVVGAPTHQTPNGHEKAEQGNRIWHGGGATHLP
jgi:hypothetical protein